MRHLIYSKLLIHLSSHQTKQRNSIAIVLCIGLLTIALASCGSTATGQTSSVTPSSTHTVSPTATPTHLPTPTPTSKPAPTKAPQLTPTPTIAPQPTQQPLATPAILDLQPLSMSIVGHLDCQKNGAYICLARVLSRPNNQSDLHWNAFTNVPGSIGFSPLNGILAPGQSVLVRITVPLNACTQGLFFFRGPVNTHTITWAC